MIFHGTWSTTDPAARLKLALVCGSVLVAAGSLVRSFDNSANARSHQVPRAVEAEIPDPIPEVSRTKAPPNCEQHTPRSIAVPAALRAPVPVALAEVAPAGVAGDSAAGLDVKQAVVLLKNMAADVSDPADVARLALALIGDAELLEELLPTFETWSHSDVPAERLRATLFLSALDEKQGVYRWREALATEGSELVRAALLEHAPLRGDPRHDAPFVETLLTAVEQDREESGRRAGLRGLPAELAPEAVDRLATAVSLEHAPELRREAAWVLARYRSRSPVVVDALAAIGLSEREDLGTRLNALRGLSGVEREYPGTLGERRSERIRAVLDELERDDLDSSRPPSPGTPSRFR